MLRSNLIHTAEPHKGLKQGHRLSSQKVGVCVGLQKEESVQSLFTEQLDPKVNSLIW